MMLLCIYTDLTRAGCKRGWWQARRYTSYSLLSISHISLLFFSLCTYIYAHGSPHIGTVSSCMQPRTIRNDWSNQKQAHADLKYILFSHTDNNDASNAMTAIAIAVVRIAIRITPLTWHSWHKHMLHLSAHFHSSVLHKISASHSL